MTTPIAPDPNSYDRAAVRAELLAIQALQPKLALYDGREFRELPKPLQDQIRSLKTITQPTASGLERVASLLWQLALLEPVLAALHEGRSIDDQLTALAQPVSDQLLLSVTPGPNDVQPPRPATSKQPSGSAASIAPTNQAPAPLGGTLTLDAADAGATVLTEPEPIGGTLVLPDDGD